MWKNYGLFYTMRIPKKIDSEATNTKFCLASFTLPSPVVYKASKKAKKMHLDTTKDKKLDMTTTVTVPKCMTENLEIHS